MFILDCLYRYNENISWVPNVPHGILRTIYQKPGGSTPPASFTSGSTVVEMEENTGRETSCYLKHIVDNWDSLAHTTIFVQASAFEWISQSQFFGLVEQQLSKPLADVAWPCSPLANEGGRDFSPVCNGDFKGTNAATFSNSDGTPSHPGIPLWEFHQQMFKRPNTSIFPVAYIPGAQFVVHSSRIRARSRYFYSCLLGAVSLHQSPALGYAMERLWGEVMSLAK